MSYKLKNYDTWKTDYPEDEPECDPEEDYEFEDDFPDFDDMVAYEMVNSDKGMSREYGYSY